MKPEFTKSEARKAVRWAQKRLGLTDWNIKLYISNLPPAWCEGDAEDVVGFFSASRPLKKVKIWIRNPSGEYCPFSTLMHEMMHLAANDVEMVNHIAESHEFLWNKLGDILAEAYKAGV